jgi:hypothetical protein
MGTSDTVLLALRPPITPQREGHVMCSPVHDDGTAMGMLCFSNGSLVREAIMVCTAMLRADSTHQVVLYHTAWLECAQKDTCGSWDAFEASLQRTVPGNGGCIGFYFSTTEIIPLGMRGWGSNACRGMG